MVFKKAYRALRLNTFYDGDFSLVPIRYEDRLLIMKWRNEQVYHLRQQGQLTESDQENYFQGIIAKLFDQEKPQQILFSFLHKDQCIGYGGLVHINWIDRNAEISFLMDTELQKNKFGDYWGVFLKMIGGIAFLNLNAPLHKIYTYAFDVRPHLYPVLEANGFRKEATLKEHCFFEGKFIDVILHSRINEVISYRKLTESDTELIFNWACDPLTRKNSFNSDDIQFDQHVKWLKEKLGNPQTYYVVMIRNGVDAGLVRFDIRRAEQTATIGILIDKGFRGLGLASRFLVKAIEGFRNTGHYEKIEAFIKPENVASVAAFEKAGFMKVEELLINDIPALKYEYN